MSAQAGTGEVHELRFASPHALHANAARLTVRRRPPRRSHHGCHCRRAAAEARHVQVCLKPRLNHCYTYYSAPAPPAWMSAGASAWADAWASGNLPPWLQPMVARLAGGPPMLRAAGSARQAEEAVLAAPLGVTEVRLEALETSRRHCLDPSLVEFLKAGFDTAGFQAQHFRSMDNYRSIGSINR